MPTLPTCKVCRLEEADIGSFVSLRAPDDQVVLGLRAWTKQTAAADLPVLVALIPKSAGYCDAAFIKPGGQGQHWVVAPEATVVNHSTNWTLHVRPQDWDGRARLRQYVPLDSGLVVMREGGEVGMLVINGGNALYLNLATWELTGARTDNFVAARRWYISIPHAGEAAWPFGKPDFAEAPAAIPS